VHGYHFSITCAERGRVAESAGWPQTSIMRPVGAMRAFESVADEPGDWAFHCHKCHHTVGDEIRGYVCVALMESRGAASKWGARRLGRVQAICTTCDGPPSSLFVAMALWAKQHTERHGWV
jgi:hypothetical protein